VRLAVVGGALAEPVAEERAGVGHEPDVRVVQLREQVLDAEPRAVRHLLGLGRDRAVPGRGVAERVVRRVVVGVVGLAERLELAGDAELFGELARAPWSGSSPSSTTPPAAKSQCAG
jgi:hypothetical protein